MKQEEKYRSRAYFILLYPDNPKHLEVMEKIHQSYEYCAIKHDFDRWTEKDKKKHPDNPDIVVGELKKEHFHYLLKFKNDKWNTALSKDLGIEQRFLEKVGNFDKALQYLIHYNDTDKYQYEKDEVFGPMKIKLEESLAKIDKTEGENVEELIEFIENHEGRLTITEFAKHSAKTGKWADFRRAGIIFVKIIEEQQVRYDYEQTKKQNEVQD